MSVPIAWLANRGLLVSTFFALLGLWAHLRWREERWSRGAAVEAGCFALALCGGEYALAAVPYVVAREALSGEGTWRRRLRATAPVLGPLVGYVVLHRLLGFGARSAAIYADPFDDPRAFLARAGRRIPLLLGEVFWSMPASGEELRRRFGTAWMFWIPAGAPASAYEDGHVAAAAVGAGLAVAVVAIARWGLARHEWRALA